ncbi:uncharacterized protein [Clytia hemisphaerica]|uniref:uncharacterized protein n=1 Tax=Clytia hemisphaerica TaxID=252671 RepID=UPI0034D792BC
MATSNNDDGQQHQHGTRETVLLRTSKVVPVISPLKSLMADQCCNLRKKGIRALSIDGDKEFVTEDVVNGIYPIIFCSPESVTGDGAFRKVVKLASKNIVAVAVDESHCIQKWGTADEKSEAFRESFSKLVELKSILPSETPFIALTATATNATVKPTLV